MSWKEPGSGGPWGGGGGQGPWGRGPNKSGGPTPPDLDELLRKGQERLRRFWPGGPGGGQGRFVLLGIVVIVVIWIITGFYTVAPDELGVVLRFGRFDHITQP